MVAFRITGFAGIVPRTADRLLPDAAAQLANNCVLTSGELQPAFQKELETDPIKQGPYLTIFKSDVGWFTWPYDVDVARSPLQGEQKYAFTGDGEPRMTTDTLAPNGGNNDYPKLWRVLGIPAPQTAPTVTPSGGTGATVSRFYAYTFYDDWNQESAPSPLTALLTGKVDDTWAVTGMDATPPNSGDITALTYASQTVTITTTNKHFNRVGEQITIAGVTTVTNVNGTWTLTAVNYTTKQMSFVVTGTPTGTYNNTTDASDTWTRKAPHGTSTKRLYRTEGTYGQFQLVAENISATTFNDNIATASIPGDELISATWAMPPATMGGIITLPNGSMCGFDGNAVCFSEPYQPHAWPPEYQMRVDYPIVGIMAYGMNVVAATTGNPYMITGYDPGQMSSQKIGVPYPCLSKRSLVDLGNAVGYASKDGFVTIGEPGADIVTKSWYTANEWGDLNPDTMVCAAANGGLYILHTYRDVTRILFFDFLHNTGLTVLNHRATDIVADATTGDLYLSATSDTGNDEIHRLPTYGGYYDTMEWHSKNIVLPEPINLGAAKVVFSSRYTQEQYDAMLAEYQVKQAANVAIVATGKVYGALNAKQVHGMMVNGSIIQNILAPSTEAPGVEFSLFADGELVVSKTMLTPTAFRLPSGYKSDQISVKVSGQSVVRSIEVAETMIGLKGA
jgi:hypothetical protein